MGQTAQIRSLALSSVFLSTAVVTVANQAVPQLADLSTFLFEAGQQADILVNQNLAEVTPVTYAVVLVRLSLGASHVHSLHREKWPHLRSGFIGTALRSAGQPSLARRCA